MSHPPPPPPDPDCTGRCGSSFSPFLLPRFSSDTRYVPTITRPGLFVCFFIGLPPPSPVSPDLACSGVLRLNRVFSDCPFFFVFLVRTLAPSLFSFSFSKICFLRFWADSRADSPFFFPLFGMTAARTRLPFFRFLRAPVDHIFESFCQSCLPRFSAPPLALPAPLGSSHSLSFFFLLRSPPKFLYCGERIRPSHLPPHRSSRVSARRRYDAPIRASSSSPFLLSRSPRAHRGCRLALCV